MPVLGGIGIMPVLGGIGILRLLFQVSHSREYVCVDIIFVSIC